jgi:IQ and AAA domain-containing protein
MVPKAGDAASDPQALDARNAARRKLLQAENKRELERDVEALKAKVQDTEGLDMREVIQDKINAWFVENRHPETGEYPDFPDADEGGYAALTAAMLQPLLLLVLHVPSPRCCMQSGHGMVPH